MPVLVGLSMKILHNACIYTLDPCNPIASAIVTDHEQILAVGTHSLLTEFDGRAQKEDLGGKVILPGLTDAHIHLQHYALSLQNIDCETETYTECLHRISERASKSEPGEWILGHGWNLNQWKDIPPAWEGRGTEREAWWPTAADLDAVAPNNPIYLTAKSLHTAWVNTTALRLANIAANTPDPDNGRIQRDAGGQPTGILLETATELVSQVIPQPSVERLAEALQQAQSMLWRVGVTCVHDFDRRACFMALQQLHALGNLHLRVIKGIPAEDLPHAVALGLSTGFGDDWLRIGSLKVFMDGALGPRTAAMFQPYLNEPKNRGMLNMDAEELFEIGRRATQIGISLAVHAIGDRANHEVLNAFAQLRSFEKMNNIPALRHRVEHVQLIHPDDTGRLAELALTASMQPIHAPSDMIMADRFWGERASLAYAWRTHQKHGTHLAFGSDAPVESPNPFWGLHAATTRQRADGSPGPEGWYPEQRLTVQEALEGYTIGAAYAAGMDGRLGRLATGYLADLIVINTDPFACSSADLLELQPVATMVGGEWVWRSEG